LGEYNNTMRMCIVDTRYSLPPADQFVQQLKHVSRLFCMQLLSLDRLHLPMAFAFCRCLRSYLAHGTGTDYMYEVLGVPMSFTWEIYGDEKATFEDCFRMFNPLGKQQFDEVVDMWVKALLHLFELLPTHPATGPVFRNVPLAKEDADAAAATEDGGAAAALPVAAKAAPPAAATQEQQQQDSEQKEEDKQQQEQQQPQQQSQQEEDASKASSPSSSVQTEEVQSPASAAAATDDQEPAVEVEQDEEYEASQDDGQQQLQQQQQQADNSTEEEIRIRRVYKGEGEDEDNGSAAWVLLHSNRLAPLLLGLGGMGVLMYIVTR
jgi:hypothetical protein